jgi:hypothetical protein
VLGVKVFFPAKQPRRTPAMTTGVSDHIWTIERNRQRLIEKVLTSMIKLRCIMIGEYLMGIESHRVLS